MFTEFWRIQLQECFTALPFGGLPNVGEVQLVTRRVSPGAPGSATTDDYHGAAALSLPTSLIVKLQLFRCFVPLGTCENSSAFQRWVWTASVFVVPAGTAEGQAMFQSSFQD